VGFLIVLLAGFLGLVTSAIYSEYVTALPIDADMSRIFGSIGREAFVPVQVFDRTGTELIAELSNPSAVQRRWYYLDPAGPLTLPPHVIQATVASHDESFWTNQGYVGEDLWGALFAGSNLEGMPRENSTITQRLVESQLIALGPSPDSRLRTSLQTALLSEDLTNRYPKEKILEWYLNSANYGELAFGIDAAALVYFGKHASELSLAESALLAPIPQNPSITPFSSLDVSIEHQVDVLLAMVDLGMIDGEQADAAFSEEIELNDPEAVGYDTLEEFLRVELETLLGESAIGRSGLRVTSSLDYDLQLQADCALRTQKTRLGGAPASSVEPSEDGSPCVASGLLPPLRPGDAEVDHQIEEFSSIVLDSSTGEILSFVGAVEQPHEIGSAIIPTIYLTAFTQGYSPGTMVLDIPESDPTQENTQGAVLNIRGPVRMRTAIANLFSFAADRTLRLVGTERVLNTMRSLGIAPVLEVEDPGEWRIEDNGIRISLLDLSFSYSTIANMGNLIGLDQTNYSGLSNGRGLKPTAISEVEDSQGNLVYRFEPQTRAVLSKQLAFLLADVLSDEAARWQTLGQSNPLEIGRPGAVFSASAADKQDFWTIGFTPSHIVGVWAGNPGGETTKGVTVLNGTAPIWHALIQYVTKDVPSESWEIPAGISRVEVCDPSGLLPTTYCPSVVQEIFIHGTEPTHADHLYQPFEINKETGKLATLGTPAGLIEERVYLVPMTSNGVSISAPSSFDFVNDEVVIRGSVHPENLAYYRLQYGIGLNPTEWFQIGVDNELAVQNGRLGTWDTDGLSGLFTLQLIAVDDDDQISSAAVHITVDDSPPEIEIIFPEELTNIEMEIGSELIIQADVHDEFGIKEVIFFLDNTELSRSSAPPYSLRVPVIVRGSHQVLIRAVDLAGNWSTSAPIDFLVR
jgi:membrane peptidoglycan carboxypeptidase